MLLLFFGIGGGGGGSCVQLADELKEHIPEGPPLFGNDVMSDKPQRFFAAEIIREQIFGCFSQEVNLMKEFFSFDINPV